MPFTPAPGPASTFTLKAKTSATSTSVNFNPNKNATGAVRLYCTTNTLMYNFGNGATTATVSSVPLAAGIVELIDVGGADTMAIFNPVGSATLYITPGFGDNNG